MFWCEDLRALCVNFSIANPDLIDAIHQLRDKIKIEARDTESRYVLLRSNNHVRVFNSVIEIVPGHGRSNQVSASADLLQKRRPHVPTWHTKRRNPNAEMTKE